MKAETLQKVLSSLGLCCKAGKGVAGTEQVCEALRKQKTLYAVFCPCDISENTRKKLTDKCAFYGVVLTELPTGGDALAHAVGKTGFCAAYGVADKNFAALLNGITEQDP